MLSIDQQQLEQKLLLMEQIIASIRSGTGLTATVPEQVAGTMPKAKGRPRIDKKALKHKAAHQVAAFLNRPDFLKYVQI